MDIEYTVADREFYAPLETAETAGDRMEPTGVPAGWSGVASTIWTMWFRPGLLAGVEDGWKVHVSAAPGRLNQVLDIVAAACFDQEVAFKHLSTRVFYWWTHQKFAARQQAGKFIAAYPTSAAAARRLMDRLRADLADEEGPQILTDRRYADSRTVHYRYGAFVPRLRVRPDGTEEHLVRDGTGALVPDRRGVSFHLPEGIADPFREQVRMSTVEGKVRSIGGFAISSAVRHTGAGGTYLGHEIATGRPVFIKEGRSHTGLREDDATATEQLREEWQHLTELHALAPGLAPEPIAFFRRWEHEFLVTELIPGVPLWSWLAVKHPMLFAGSTPERFAAYYARCETIIAGVERELARLHSVGYLFVDVSPGNILVDADDTVRLVDFGTAHRMGTPFRWGGTPGYAPPVGLIGDDLAVHDEYGVCALAQLLTAPLHAVVRLNPDALTHLHHDLTELAPVPAALWQRVTRFHPPSESPRLPGPEQVAADPARHLTELRDRMADALIAMADVSHPHRVFPTVIEGFQTNALCVAYGTAGVVHALRRAGRPLPDGVLDRLRADALGSLESLAPGLHVGSAGVARVLADCGLLAEARTLLDFADTHPLTGECATLAGGAAGVAMAHLALYGHTRDEHHIDRALALAASLPADDELVEQLGPNDATGLLHGRCGVALMLQQLAAVTGDPAPLARAVRLLWAELDRATDPHAHGLLFPISATDRRAVPYLFAGSAGMVYTATRCLRATDDDRLTEALPRLLAPLRLTYTAMPGLYRGLAGQAFTLADHARLTGDATSRRAAVRDAQGLMKFALPHPTGVRLLGDRQLRYSAELWSGSAGVLLALTQVLDPRPDGLFAVDSVAAPRWLHDGLAGSAELAPAVLTSAR